LPWTGPQLYQASPSRKALIRLCGSKATKETISPRYKQFLATATIDKHSDHAASEEERKVRKRKLVEGPSVFRDARKDGQASEA
jgi:hypothetical protein